MIIKNKCGYELLEYIPCDEQEIKQSGRIEKGESARQAAIREVFEETHQKVENVEFKGLFKKKRPSGEIVYMAIFSCIKDEILPFIKQDDDENDEIKLWDLQEDIGYVDEIDLKIIELIQDQP